MAAAPTVASQMVLLGELLNTAGAGDGIRQYLAAKKISATPTLALIAKNAEDFTTMIVAPFLAGVNIDGRDHKRLVRRVRAGALQGQCRRCRLQASGSRVCFVGEG